MAAPPLQLLLILFGTVAAALNQDGVILLDAKRGLSDPGGALSSWNAGDDTPCAWEGIRCSPSTGAVTSVDLTNFNLSGEFPAVLCRLPSLEILSLAYNYINGTLSVAALSRCRAVAHLDLSQNYFVGPLPELAAALPELRYLDLSANNFSGVIPRSYGGFKKLEVLSLVANLLSGEVPPFLGNLSSLRQLNLSYNPFSPSPVPDTLARAAGLEILWLAGCNLVGRIPPSLGALANLTDLDLSSNALTGPIPPELTSLPAAVQIELYNNSLSGEIPAGFGKLPNLRFIDFSMNKLDGPLPDDIFSPPRLESLHLYSNRLTGAVPATAAAAPALQELRLFANRLAGSLPPELGKNSPLVVLDLSDNALSGEIPPDVCSRGVLEQLLLIDNSFSGGLPAGLGRCRTLRRVRLLNNRLDGGVPDGLWGLPHLELLELTGNALVGEISPVISGAANLTKLLISGNRFAGRIPSEIGMLSKLYDFSAADNRLSGPLPASLGGLTDLGRLHLPNNTLSGELLRGVQSWKKLSELDLAHNAFTGGIPPELGDLPVLNYLDLSGNRLTGGIPVQLQNLKLNQFNLSDNDLSGEVPPLYATPAYRDSFLGNPELCGDNLASICPASRRRSETRSAYLWMLRAIFIFAGVVLAAGVALFYWRCRRKQNSSKLVGLDKTKWTLTTFHKLGFSEYEILDCLDEDNVIGSGSSGKVYKAVLSNGEAIAVKKLWSHRAAKTDIEHGAVTTADDGFDAEVATLGKIRHKNIVKLWCCCTHQDCKLLVYEYMLNGSLGDVLHSSKAGMLDWPTRFKIAVDAAEGLSYLHHDCVPPIVHRDVKSNNILLDAEFGARVADFGVAKVVEAAQGDKTMSVIAGSCGYIAPEYAYTLRVNEKSDIYSFGVVLLELVTGRPPIGPELGEKDLVKWTAATVDQKGAEHVVDPKLDIGSFKDAIVKVLNIGLLCASSLPINRPSMRRVVKMLHEVHAGGVNPLATAAGKRDGKLSPYYYEDNSDHGSSL